MKTQKYADAYCHLGRPRFGSTAQVLAMWDRVGIGQGVLVLGPGVPAFDDMVEALSNHGDRVRGVGIPFGSTPQRRLESVRLVVDSGAIGCRIDSREALENPDVLAYLGERGLWAYGIGPCRSAELANLYLDWLASYPQARIASPHFLRSTPLDLAGDPGQAYRRLLSHDRFFPILSRHGGASAEPYPHRDLQRWVEQVLELVPFERILWGSEYPCLYWRNETPETCIAWLADLVPTLKVADLRRYHVENTTRLFFESPPPEPRTITVPDWVEEEFDREGIVALLPNASLDVPMPDYQFLLSDFLARRDAGEEKLLFGPYLAEQLSVRARELAGS